MTERFSSFLKLTLALIVVYLGAYLFVAISRMNYPFELEWMEGGCLQHVDRILLGGKLYVAPTLDFVPFIYTPLYFYAAAIISKTITGGFIALRSLSFLSSLGSLLLIYFLVKYETRRAFPAVLAAGLFIATFRLGGVWFDLGRPDSVFLFLLLLAVYLLRVSSSRWSAVVAGLVFALSFFTKQTAMFVALPLIVYLLLMERRRAVYFIGTLVMALGGGVLWLNAVHDGWFTYYTLDLPRYHELTKGTLIRFWFVDIFKPLALATLLSLLYMYRQWRQTDRKRFVFYLLFALGMIGSAWVVRMRVGGYDNVLIPAYTAISILFGLAVHATDEFIRTHSERDRSSITMFVYAACVIQFGALFYNPLDQLPDPADEAKNKQIVQKIASFGGDVLVPCHGYLAVMAGKPSQAHYLAIRDFFRAENGQGSTELTEDITRHLRARHYSAVFLDSAIVLDWVWLRDEIEKYYYLQEQIPATDSPLPIIGATASPRFIYVPRSDPGEVP